MIGMSNCSSARLRLCRRAMSFHVPSNRLWQLSRLAAMRDLRRPSSGPEARFLDFGGSRVRAVVGGAALGARRPAAYRMLGDIEAHLGETIALQAAVSTYLPHHRIDAQSAAPRRLPLARYWCTTAFSYGQRENVKSLGTIITVGECSRRATAGRCCLLVVVRHYRTLRDGRVVVH